MPPERSLIEEYLPLRVIGTESRREKIGHSAAHPRKLHLWWARRPLAACRAAIYAALVPAPESLDPRAIAESFRQRIVWDAPDELLDPWRGEILAANGGKPPKVLDMFAGGGAIPLEAARLGCEAYAVELNPVAYLIELCTLVYPQKYGPSLADDVERWGAWMIERVKAAVGDLYPDIPSENGRLVPVAYLWTRTVPCPNPAEPPHDAHLVRQTWLVKKKGAYRALKPVPDRESMAVAYEVSGEVAHQEDLGFDPGEGSARGTVGCRLCGASVGVARVKQEANRTGFGTNLMAVVASAPGQQGKIFVAAAEAPPVDGGRVLDRIQALADGGMAPPSLPIGARRITGGSCVVYGLTNFADLYTNRQTLTLLTFCKVVRLAYNEMISEGMSSDRAVAVATYLGLCVDRIADRSSTLCRWDSSVPKTANTFARQALPMIWDFSEINPFGGASGDVSMQVRDSANAIRLCARAGAAARVARGSATALSIGAESIDAVVTDPPYYDNIAYADLSDFFYVWLQRSIGQLYPEHFSAETTPKRREAIVAKYRHGGDAQEARRFYEEQMQLSFQEAHRVLKPGAPLVCVYAHKTTLGWSTLVRSLQKAGFTVTEAWPLDTEMPDRVGQMNTASLASSIFLVARKRKGGSVGDADTVAAEVRTIVAERIKTLQAAGIAGADLVIAAVGAGLRAYTQHERVERPNGEELDPETYLQQVQTLVLEAWGKDLGVSGADRTSRFYVFAVREFGHAAVPFDEVNTLARGAGVELSGPKGLTEGDGALVEHGKKRSEVRVRDFQKRGAQDDLGAAGTPLVDVLHRLLWLRANDSPRSAAFVRAARPDSGRLKVLAHALAGPALDTATSDLSDEQKAIQRLLASWPQVVDKPLETSAGAQRQMSL